MKKLVIFDFDGTLVDTVTDVVECFNKALSERGHQTYTVPEFSKFVGGNLEAIVSALLPENKRTTDEVDIVKNRYREFYLNSDKPNSKPYKDIMTVINTLRDKGIKMAINSNKGQSLLDAMVNDIFSEYSFVDIIGYDEKFPCKPDPYGVNVIMEKSGCQREETVYIGDGHSDIMTAYNADIACILATWGQTKDDDLKNDKVWKIATKAMDILEFLKLEDTK